MATEKPTHFVDTNIFIRFLANDHPDKAERVLSLLERAVKGEVVLVTSLMVIAEIVWTLESFYGLSKAEIAPRIESILTTPNLRCPESETILQALDLYAAKNIDFIDAYHAFLLKKSGLPTIVTYDRKHFARVPWLEIVEP